jgi:putative Mn2+ efflux pump MntP
MADQQIVTQEKSPVGAAILSAIFPGLGLFYVGNAMKAIAYLIIFACLIILQVKGRGHEHVVVALMIAGFYIFQIFDSFEEARKTHYKPHQERVEPDMQTSLFAGGLIMAIGIAFQLAELDIIRYRDILRIWPLILIVMGGKFIWSFLQENQKEKEEKFEEQSDE